MATRVIAGEPKGSKSQKTKPKRQMKKKRVQSTMLLKHYLYTRDCQAQTN